MDDFRGKLAVITGGGSGMGRALAQELTSEGCHVAICGTAHDEGIVCSPACRDPT